LLEQIMNSSPSFFERLVVDLLVTAIQPGNVAAELPALSHDTKAVERYGQPSGARILDHEDSWRSRPPFRSARPFRPDSSILAGAENGAGRC
jgi:hypothetical protein